MPDDLVISNERAVEIFEEQLYDDDGKHRYPGHVPIAMVFLFALERMYPCEQSDDR